MKTILDKPTRDSLIERINTLTEASTAAWGTMNVYQMVTHCILAEEMNLGKKIFKRSFLGRLIGKMILKKMLKDEDPMQKNAPTSAEFKIAETSGDFLAQKAKWIALVEQYGDFTNPHITHWFFGKMTREEVGYLVYKHIDHHLRQFKS